MVVGGSLLFLGACSPRSEPSVSPPRAQQSPASQPITGQEFKQRQIAFLILDRSVEMNRIPDLMRTLLTQMAREFPEQDLTVVAYTPSSPPQKVGTGHLDSRTKEMNYLPEY